MKRIACALAAVALTMTGAQAQQLGPGGAEIWDLSDPAQPRHWFTGFRCWEAVGELQFDTRTAFESVGGDVACGYSTSQVFATVYVTLRRPLGTDYAAVVEATRQEVRARYENARVLSDTQREIRTSAGAITVDELILSVSGRDLQTQRDMRGVSGAWHVDVEGWTLKLRLSNYGGGDARWAQQLAESILARAYADMETARACAGAGAEPAPNPALSDEDAVNLDVAAAIMVPMLQGAIPADPAAARAAGFVCLGETLQANTGALVTAVMQPPSAAGGAVLTPAPDAAMRVVALGEIRDGASPPAMIAIVQAGLNPFGVDGVRSDRAQLAFSFHPDRQGFLGTVGAPPRLAAAQAASYYASGGAARVTVTRQPRTQE